MPQLPSVLLLSAIALALAACEPRAGLSAQSCDDPFADEGGIRFNTAGWETDFCKKSVPLSDFRSGGPPRDGIPPIDEPSFVTVSEADEWIGDREPVISLQIGDAIRAYPLQVLTWHEIVNDELGGTPVSVTFCPLCYAAIVFERPEHEGELLTFGTTGNLRNSDLVMWDRQTESWWQQFSGEAVVGLLTGQKLTILPSALTSWEEFRVRYPHAEVLSKDTGHARRYGENPYVGYDDASQPPWLYDGPVGEALRPMDRVIGVEIGDTARAYTLEEVRNKRVLQDVVSGEPVAIFWTKYAASALDDQAIRASKRIGSVGVFSAVRAGDALTFEERDGLFVDDQTGSTWNIFGEAVEGPATGERLEPVVHHNTFWFVWGAFKGPETLGSRI